MPVPGRRGAARPRRARRGCLRSSARAASGRAPCVLPAARPRRRRGSRVRRQGRPSARGCSRAPIDRPHAETGREPRRGVAPRCGSRRLSCRQTRARRVRVRHRAGRSARAAARAPPRGLRRAAGSAPSVSSRYARRTSTAALPASSPACANRAALSSSSSARSRKVAARPHDPSLVREDIADGGVAGDLGERLQRVLEHDAQPGAAGGLARPDLRDVDRGGDPLGRAGERAEEADAPGQKLLGAGQVPADPVRDAE